MMTDGCSDHDGAGGGGAEWCYDDEDYNDHDFDRVDRADDDVPLPCLR